MCQSQHRVDPELSLLLHIFHIVLSSLTPLYAIDEATDEQLFVLVLLATGTFPCGGLATVAMTARATV